MFFMEKWELTFPTPRMDMIRPVKNSSVARKVRGRDSQEVVRRTEEALHLDNFRESASLGLEVRNNRGFLGDKVDVQDNLETAPHCRRIKLRARYPRITPSPSSRCTRRKQGPGVRPTREASSTFVIRPSRTSSSRIA